jgi:filamentous hemagglutinin family protein
MKTIASSLVLALVSVGVGAIDAQAQVTPDSTLGTPTVLLSAPGNPLVVIGGGTTRGTSLFHSFSQFSVPNPGGAIFNNPTTIETIFARVTGTTSSTINGLLQTQGKASLFLMNPNGIIFGPNALLDIKGSFIATTANQVQFGPQNFSTVTRNDAPLLTVNVPIGLQLSPTSGSIIVNSTGHTLTTTDTTGLAPLIATSRPGLQLRPNNTIVLLGNNVTLNNGVVGAAQGRIEVGSVRDGIVQIEKTGTNWQLGYSGITDFSAVTMKGRSLLDVGGVNAGSIQVQGRGIKILDGSNIFSQNVGPIAGGLIQVKASESIEITGVTADGIMRSAIESETLGVGASSKIIVTAPKITIAQGAGIFSKSFRQGIGSDVEVNASDRLDLLSFAPINPVLNSSVGTITVGPANSGNLLVNAKEINLYQGGSLNAITFGTGSSGLLTVNADTIVMGGGLTPLTSPSAIIVNTFGLGNSGVLTVNTRTLDMVRGGSISSASYRSGKAGSVTVNASESIFMDGYLDDNNQRISATINSSILIAEGQLRQLLNLIATPTANAGLVEINTPRLELRNLSSITARNEGTGMGGDVKINAEEVLLKADSRVSVFTASGKGGSLELNANLIALSNQSQFSASAGGSGQGGTIKIRTQDLSLINNSTINAIVKDGDAGTISIEAAKTISLDASNIVGNTTGKGNGALIKITTPELNLRNQSQISSSSLKSGNAGNIQILSSDRISLDNKSQITNQSAGEGQGGIIELSSRSLSLNNSSQINASTVFSDGGNLNLTITDLLQLRNGSLLNAEAGGAGNGGNISIDSRFMFGGGNSDIIANAVLGSGGTVEIKSEGVFGLQYRSVRTAENDITASSQFGLQGSVTINGLNIDPANGINALNTDILDPSQQVSNQCATSQGSQFIATGRGGIPQSPLKKKATDRPWNDLRVSFPEASPTKSAQHLITHQASLPTTVQPIVEATALQVDESGTIVLVAPNPIASHPPATCARQAMP